LSLLSDALAMMQDPGPVIGSMNTMPINDKLVTDVLEELWPVVEHPGINNH
jgi:hypothetical protein